MARYKVHVDDVLDGTGVNEWYVSEAGIRAVCSFLVEQGWSYTVERVA